MTDLRRLAPADARTLLALAGMALVAKRTHERPEEWIAIDGPEASDEAIRAACHRILVEKRLALGMEKVDFTHLVEGGAGFAPVRCDGWNMSESVHVGGMHPSRRGG